MVAFISNFINLQKKNSTNIFPIRSPHASSITSTCMYGFEIELKISYFSFEKLRFSFQVCDRLLKRKSLEWLLKEALGRQKRTPSKVSNFIVAFQRKKKIFSIQYYFKSIQTLIVCFGHLWYDRLPAIIEPRPHWWEASAITTILGFHCHAIN